MISETPSLPKDTNGRFVEILKSVLSLYAKEIYKLEKRIKKLEEP